MNANKLNKKREIPFEDKHTNAKMSIEMKRHTFSFIFVYLILLKRYDGVNLYIFCF